MLDPDIVSGCTKPAMTSRNDHAAICAHAAHDHHHGQQVSAGPAHGAIVRDPVCGMEVETDRATHKLQLGGATNHFCSSRCLEKFKAWVRGSKDPR